MKHFAEVLGLGVLSRLDDMPNVRSIRGLMRRFYNKYEREHHVKIDEEVKTSMAPVSTIPSHTMTWLMDGSTSRDVWLRRWAYPKKSKTLPTSLWSTSFACTNTYGAMIVTITGMKEAEWIYQLC